MNKRFYFGFLALAMTIGLNAQSGTNSPYSQYGIGVLSDQSSGFLRGMNGAGIGMRQGNVVNPLNPASYSSIDSLTMIFDLGVSGQITNFREDGANGAVSVNAKNANFEYALGSFRLIRRVGMAFGLLPYSNIGYKYTTSTKLDDVNGTVTETYQGNGGLHQLFLGAGWQITKPLSVGVNVSYIWGDLSRTVTSSNTTYINSLARSYSSNVGSYKIDLGVQYNHYFNKTDLLTIGATMNVGHKLTGDVACEVMNVNNNDTTSYKIANGYSIPMAYGLGLSWRHADKLLVNADFTLQQWGKLDYPDINSNGQYELQSGLLKDRYATTVGMDYVPDAYGRKLYQRIHYRLGAGYATPYYKINGADGPKEISVSAGLGIPLQNSYNNRSVLNVSAQWVQTSAPGLIKDNSFRVNIGLTFNERWFAKWKVE